MNNLTHPKLNGNTGILIENFSNNTNHHAYCIIPKNVLSYFSGMTALSY